MRKIAAGLIIGIIVGYALFSQKDKAQVESSTTQSSLDQEALEVKKPSSPLPSAKRVVQAPEPQVKETTSLQLEKPVESSPRIAAEMQVEEQEAPPKVLSLDVSEMQIAQMEQQIEELQRDVSLYRERNGWVVRFHRKNNTLARIGVQENDLIRDGHFDSLKQVPGKAELMARLEAVINHLQR